MKLGMKWLTSSSSPQFSKSITSNLTLLKIASSASQDLLSSLTPESTKYCVVIFHWLQKMEWAGLNNFQLLLVLKPLSNQFVD